ncbi:hypothetical protein BKA70DRAFT_1479666 [Coprinopsis sp. MPI-PUGE-AT-0042]|nr:hypothetical protein BKA70DRAFT_1479666 [Coprinopsis sp. MPI-PUGE-AT-0042]
MSSALPNLNTLVLKSRFVGSTIWRPRGWFVHRTLEKLELSELRSSPIHVANILRGFPALKSLMLTDCSVDSLTKPHPLGIHPCIQEVILHGETSGYLLRDLTFPSLTRVVLNAVKRAISWGRIKFDPEAPLALGSFIQRSDLSAVTLCLEYSYPHICLNIILSSTTKVATIEVPALPILFNEAGNGPGLRIPPSVEWIVSHTDRAVSGQDRARWLASLKDCLQYPLHQSLSVRLGADDIVRI